MAIDGVGAIYNQCSFLFTKNTEWFLPHLPLLTEWKDKEKENWEGNKGKDRKVAGEAGRRGCVEGWESQRASALPSRMENKPLPRAAPD